MSGDLHGAAGIFLLADRKRFDGRVVPESDVFSIQEGKQCLLRPFVDFTAGVLASVIPGEKRSPQRHGRPMPGSLDQVRDEFGEPLVGNVVLRPGNESANGRIVDLLVFAVLEQIDGKANGAAVFRKGLVEFGTRPAATGLAKTTGQERTHRFHVHAAESVVPLPEPQHVEVAPVATAVDELVVFRRFVDEHEHRHGFSGLDDGEKTVLAVQQNAFAGEGGALMRPLPEPGFDLLDILPDHLGTGGTVDPIVNEPLPGQFRRDVDDENVVERNGVEGKNPLHKSPFFCKSCKWDVVMFRMLSFTELFDDVFGERNGCFASVVGAKSFENQKGAFPCIFAWKMSDQLGDKHFRLIVGQVGQGR